MPSFVMLNVTYKPSMLCVVAPQIVLPSVLSVVMLNVVVVSVVAPLIVLLIIGQFLL